MASGTLALDLLPRREDLPGDGWRMIGASAAGQGDEGAELFDCVGPTFPRDEEIVSTGESARFVQPPRRLLYAVSVEFDAAETTARAVQILQGDAFAACLGRSVAADLAADSSNAELLDVEVLPVVATAGCRGSRLSFTAGGEHGIMAVHLDLVTITVDEAAAVLWLGDTDHPFPGDERDHVIDRIMERVR